MSIQTTENTDMQGKKKKTVTEATIVTSDIVSKNYRFSETESKPHENRKS